MKVSTPVMRHPSHSGILNIVAGTINKDIECDITYVPCDMILIAMAEPMTSC